MTHTKDGVVIDAATGVVRLVIVPDSDAELEDPAFRPAGCLLLAVPHDPAADPVVTAQAMYPAARVKMPPAAALSQGGFSEEPVHVDEPPT